MVALLILRMFLVQWNAFVERNIDPAVGMPALRWDDLLLLWMTEERLELPNRTTLDDFVTDSFSARSRVLTRMPHWSGGLGIVSAERRCRVAFV